MNDLEDLLYGQEEETLLSSLVKGRELEKWQHYFCNIANIFICCVDSQGNPLTSFGGKIEEADKVKKTIDGEQFQNMLLRVCESTLEDQAVETTAYPNVRLALISGRVQGKAVINWLVCGVLDDVKDTEDYENPPLEGITNVISERQFLKTIDTLRDISDELLSYKYAKVSADMAGRRSRLSEKEMAAGQKRAEALTEAIQFLESGEPTEIIIGKLLSLVGELLDLSTAAVYRISKSGQYPHIVSKWCKKKTVWEFETFTDISLLRTEKTLVLSAASMKNVGEKEELEALGLKAVIIIPVLADNLENLRVCFGEITKERTWTLGEIKFLNDAVRILQSILTRRAQKDALSNINLSLENMLDHVKSAVYVKNTATGEMLFANRSMRRIFREEMENKTINSILDGWLHADDACREVFDSQKERWFDFYHTRIKWGDGGNALLCVLYDITERKNHQKQLEKQVRIDFLTGLYNRMGCEDDLARYVEEASAQGRKGMLLYMDLDNFKHINDGLGHQYGDVLLKAISHSLKQVEGIEDCCYRMGGDEFVIIVPPDKYEQLDKITASIESIFAKPWFLKDADYYCTMSMGAVEFPTEGSEVHELVKKADIAMYEAKKGGKNRTARYSADMDARSGKRLDMEKNMRDATVKGYQEFKVYYQPIIDIHGKNYSCIGAEALIRWNNAEMGYMSPAEFIPLAEYLGLINPIGAYVLQEACKNCRRWNRSGHPEYKVNVNLSVVQLLQTDIVETIEKVIKDTGITPHNLMLEVTEDLAINDMEHMKEILSGIKKLGVQIALDDFGTGYSSLNHIREFPLDLIKVDQSFVKDLDRDAYARSFIRMVGDLAENLDVQLCVEGVETKGQLEILSEMGVGQVQGFYFDRPMSFRAFEKKYAQKNKKEVWPQRR